MFSTLSKTKHVSEICQDLQMLSIRWSPKYSHLVESTRELTLSHRTNFNSSKLKQFADNNFKFNENGRKFSRQVENTVGKRRNCPWHCFVWQTSKIQGSFGNGLNDEICLRNKRRLYREWKNMLVASILFSFSQNVFQSFLYFSENLEICIICWVIKTKPL